MIFCFFDFIVAWLPPPSPVEYVLSICCFYVSALTASTMTHVQVLRRAACFLKTVQHVAVACTSV